MAKVKHVRYDSPMTVEKPQDAGLQPASVKKTPWLLTTSGYNLIAGLWGSSALCNSVNVVLNVIEVDPGGTLISGLIASLNFVLAGHYVYLGHVKPLQEKNQQYEVRSQESSTDADNR